MTTIEMTWRLRNIMADRGIFKTTDLVPLLADRGVHLSREQVYRLVTSKPARLNVEVLGALCDILGCGPSDLLKFTATHEQRPTATGETGLQPIGDLRPIPATIRRPN